MRAVPAVLAAVALLAPGMAWAATQADAQAALANARTAEADAGKIGNRWMPTEEALKQAKQELDAGKYDAALATARRAEALAKRSIEQAREQDKLWRNEVVR